VAEYSVYEAKARLSEVLRLVKARREVVITERGKPIARILPFEDAKEATLDARIERLVIIPRGKLCLRASRPAQCFPSPARPPARSNDSWTTATNEKGPRRHLRPRRPSLLGEAEARRGARMLRAHDQAFSVGLVVPEILSALKREERPLNEADRLLARLSLFFSDGSLKTECEEALSAGFLRGADLWHVATALAIAGRQRRKELLFATFDERRREVAKKLQFPVAF
jgi:prevent-host-death family protein